MSDFIIIYHRNRLLLIIYYSKLTWFSEQYSALSFILSLYCTIFRICVFLLFSLPEYRISTRAKILHFALIAPPLFRQHLILSILFLFVITSVPSVLSAHTFTILPSSKPASSKRFVHCRRPCRLILDSPCASSACHTPAYRLVLFFYHKINTAPCGAANFLRWSS